jgi:hypothetical protein
VLGAIKGVNLLQLKNKFIMKSNANSINTGAKNNSGKRHQAAAKKSTTRNMDTTPATEKARSKTSHGHGLMNEGTNVNYDEER